jgi:FdrA protein
MSYRLSMVKRNSYYDSVKLMQVSRSIQEIEGVNDAVVMVGTKQNKEFINSTGMVTEEVKESTSNDIFVVIEAKSRFIAEKALEQAEILLSGRGFSANSSRKNIYYSTESAITEFGAKIAIISIPGQYVKREALYCLERGLHLHIFSDNVPEEDELIIKQKAYESGLLVMGPDCGTALIHKAALGFANAVNRGPIGIVGASGSGLQEVSCLVDICNSGVSHAIGVGSNDLSSYIGGISTEQGICILEKDNNTKVVVVISKPPSYTVAKKIIAILENCTKPVVVNFIGTNKSDHKPNNNIYFMETLEEAALKAVSLVSGSTDNFTDLNATNNCINESRGSSDAEKKYIRGIYSGGTFASEAAFIIKKELSEVNTNISIGTELSDPNKSLRHSCIDMGADFFTSGKPHPMIEPFERNKRIVKELNDPETAVIVFDLILGYGSHPNPAGDLVNFLSDNYKNNNNGKVILVASVCGTDKDQQDRSKQVEILRNAGVCVMPSVPATP